MTLGNTILTADKKREVTHVVNLKPINELVFITAVRKF